MGLTEIQKQTIAQRLRDGISIRAIAAEVGVDKGTAVPFYWPNKKSNLY
jgi:IS30 family transposase